ncbi:hypothetical protein [Clostridium tyrobutyricum]|jgi:hypothetical protein|nr:hypothetical protein [Clostridium tyrobutyricum]
MNFLWIRHSLRFREFYDMSEYEQKLYLASAELEMEMEEKMRKK